jgi:hypothetical protein
MACASLMSRGASPPTPSPGRRIVIVGLVCVLLAVASLAVPSVPTYDPMAWLLWGREISSGELHTTGGPSWKPLPVLVTTMFAAAGDMAPELWLIVARAGLLGSVAVGFVLARRLAGLLAGCLAAGILLVAPWMLAGGLRGYSEGIAVLLVLAAIERHDRGRAAQAFWLGVGVALLRPEGAVLVGAYGVWLACRDARRWPWVVGGGLLVAVLWTVPELWGSGSLWRAAERAQDVRPGSAALADRPAYEIGKLALTLVTPPGAVVALMAVWLAARGAVTTRARPLVAYLAGISVAWTALVAAMTERGFAGNWRYLVIPAALTLVLAAVGVGWLWSVILPRFGTSARLLRPASLGLSVGIVATYVVLAVPQTLRTYAFEVEVNKEMEVVLTRLGGAERLRRCGRIYVNPFLVQRLAWELHQPSMTIAGVHHVPPDVSGAILRARLTADHPPLPRANSRPQDEQAALLRTDQWDVELRCDSGQPTSRATRKPSPAGGSYGLSRGVRARASTQAVQCSARGNTSHAASSRRQVSCAVAPRELRTRRDR